MSADVNNTKEVTGGPGSSIAMVVALALLFTSERVIGEGALHMPVAIAAAVLGVLALAWRIRSVTKATGDTRAVETRLLGAQLGVVGSLLVYAASTQAGLEAFGWTGDAAARAGGALSALWPAILIVSLLALLFMELVYARMPIARSVELRRVRTAMHAGLTLGFSVVFLFSVNFIASERDVRKDVSYFQTTRPSDGSRALVQKLDKPLRVTLFYRQTDDVLSQVKPYFESLVAAAKGKLTLTVVDFALVPELARKHRIRDNGFVLLTWGEGDAEQGQSFKVGKDLMEARATLRKLDGEFQQRFHKLTQPERIVSLTVGHGERNSKLEDAEPGDGTADLDTLLKRLNVKTNKLGVGQGLGSAVPDNATAVLVVGPREPFMEEEAQSLLSYARMGGRLLLMLDPDQDVGLGPLLSGLGLTQLPGTLASDKDHVRRTYTASDRAIVFSNSYSAHPVVTTVSRHRELATLFYRGAAFARAETATGPTGNDVKATVTFPLRSGNDFWRETDNLFQRGPNEKPEALNMIAAVKLEKPGRPEGRVVVIGDGDFATDRLIRNPGNSVLLIDTLGWLIGDEKIQGDTTSEEDIAIEHTRAEDKLWFYATTFLFPLPVLGLGLWIVRRRRQRSEVRS